MDAYTSYDTYGDDALKVVIFSVNQKGRSHGVVVKEFIFDNSIESRAGMYYEGSYYYAILISFSHTQNIPFNTSFHCFIAITNAALDLSPVLLGVLFTLLLLCSVIFAKVYCNRASATMRDLNSDVKQNMNSISYKHDAQKVENFLHLFYILLCAVLKLDDQKKSAELE